MAEAFKAGERQDEAFAEANQLAAQAALVHQTKDVLEHLRDLALLVDSADLRDKAEAKAALKKLSDYINEALPEPGSRIDKESA